MSRNKVCVINVVGLTPELLAHAPNISKLGTATPWKPPLPAVTCTSQATMLTGLKPAEHGIVGNGWYFRETAEVRFWQQSRNLIQAESLVYDGIETAKMFWWFNQHAPVRWSATPKPHYGSDGSKVFDILDNTECNLVEKLGPFPFFSFWGPNAGLPASDWIAKATAVVLKEKEPTLTLVYLPHLDYDFQRLSSPSMERVREVDRCAETVIQAAHAIGAKPIIVSEYGLVPVDKPIGINRILREHGWLVVRDGPFGEQLMPGDSKAFAVVDHQLAHIYVKNPSDRSAVRRCVESIDGVAQVVDPVDIGLGHSRSGEWIALAQPSAWFHYYFWLDDARAPDYARTVDIHRKPGYDPVELFMTSKMRAIARVAQKKLGFRYRMDVIPLKPELVQGSHGLLTSPEKGPLIIGPGAPNDMLQFKDYIRCLVG
ncbi:MAG: alkaline phosphatase family protein [Pirellula sp.]|nr:alkaline phosphatase family protein [Pirellula sp.]